MKTRNNIVEYFNGIMSYYNYFCGNLGAISDMEAIKDINNIRAAKMALVALFFETKKEDMIVEKAIDENTKEYIAKVDDTSLIDAVEILSKKDPDGKYRLGELETYNPLEIISFVRHSLAHSRYCVDLDNNKINIDNKSLKAEVDIDKLFIFTIASCYETLRFPKTKKHCRYDCDNKKEFKKQIKNIDDLRLAVKTSNCFEHTITSMDDNNIDKEVLGYFASLMDHREKSDEILVKQLTKKFENFANSKNATYMVCKKKLRDEQIEEMVEYIHNTEGFYDWDAETQKSFVLRRIGNRLSPDTEKDMYLSGLMYNLLTLEDMETIKEFDLAEINKTKKINLNNTLNDCLLTSLFAAFNAIYIYPLETMYTNKLEYSLEREKELDFGLLDLSFINPTVLNINTNPLTEHQKIIDKKLKEYRGLERQKEEILKHLARAKERNNTFGIEKQQQDLDLVESEMDNLYDDVLTEVDYHLRLEDDFELKYHRNKAIIVGLRNSIAHGQVRIKRFNGERDLDDTTIIFRNIHKGEISFEAELTLKDIEKLLDRETTKPLVDFLEKHYSYIEEDKEVITEKVVEEPVVEEVIEPVVEEPKKEEKGFQKVFKRIFKK